MSGPDKVEENGVSERDRSGRFVKGHKGIGGRPKGTDIRKATEDYAAELGVNLPEELGRVGWAMILKAQKGDVQAAKLCMDYICYSAKDGGDGKPIVVKLESGVARRVQVDD